MKLPQLLKVPTLHPDCCCPLSTTLIDGLVGILKSNPGWTLSIGSGSGLLEAFLLHHSPPVNVHAVEVSTAINKYLPDERLQIVRGTWDLASVAKDATAWMFVYPREIELIRKYIRAYSRQVRQIIWLGPLADRDEVKEVLLSESWNLQGTVKSIGHGSCMLQARRKANS